MFRASLAVLAVTVASSLAVSAHHPFGEVYVENREITIEGDVLQWEYRNPHSFVQIVTVNARSETERWIVELRGASQLYRMGVTYTTFKPGQRVIVTGSPGRVAADRRLRLRAIVRPQDGWKWRDGVE